METALPNVQGEDISLTMLESLLSGTESLLIAAQGREAVVRPRSGGETWTWDLRPLL
jgi:hypothetical protein